MIIQVARRKPWYLKLWERIKRHEDWEKRERLARRIKYLMEESKWIGRRV